MGTVTEFAEKVKNSDPDEDKPAGDPTDIAEATDGSNIARAYEAGAEFIDKIEAEQAKIDEINEKAKEEKAPYSQRIKELKKEFREEYTIDTKSFNDLLAIRKAERRLVDRVEKQTAEQRDDFKGLLDNSQEQIGINFEKLFG